MVERQLPKQMATNGLVLIPSPMTPSPEPKWATPVGEGGISSSQKIQYDDNMSTMERVVLCLAEFVGTAILVFLGCLGCANKSSEPPAEQVSLTFGFAILIALQAIGHISGGHINPSVTMAAFVMGVIPVIQVPIYLMGQILGAIAGYSLILVAAPSSYITKENATVSLCSPSPNKDFTQVQIALIELLLTLFLVWTVCAIWDSRNGQKTETVPMKIGFTVAGLALAGGSFTGAHMNPARTFGPALVNGDWKHHWMYWIGPLLAGVAGGLSYRIIFLKANEAEKKARDVP